jgi:hypothetical protein
MRWLKHTTSVLLVLAAAAIVLSTALSDHSDDYGQVPLPQGGMVNLPKGETTVFYTVLGDNSDPIKQVAPLGFQVAPVRGGPPLTMSSTDGGSTDVTVTRSETIGELGAVAKLDVPSAGDYSVSGTTNLPPGTSFLEFGTNSATAVLHKWRLLAGLLLAAFLIGFIPTPRPRRHWEDEHGPSGWSSDPRAPYAG